MIIAFGSVARHDAKDHSDLDLLVIFDKVEDQKETHAMIAKQFIGLRFISFQPNIPYKCLHFSSESKHSDVLSA